MALTSVQQRRLTGATDCEIRFDDLTRQLYATDASIYQIEPVGVAFPRNAADASSVVRAAAEAGISIIPRGAGTGLAGGAVGEGLIIDFARYNRQIGGLDLEQRTVRVAPGVVLDQLNALVAPHGLWFGPDVATSSRATLGGMIANNSSGARAPVYGTCAEHVRSLEVILADGRVVTVGQGHDSLPEIRAAIDAISSREHARIRETLHGRIAKRWPGYGFDRYLNQPGDLARIITGSEGTLAAIMTAELNLVPMPKRRGLGVLFFASVPEAMQATVELLDLKPAAIEHIDRLLFDQTRGQMAFAAARSLLRLDEEPCEAMLVVEFFDSDIEEKLDLLAGRKIGLRTLVCAESVEQAKIWGLRKQGLSLVTACPGKAKPTPGIEDVCVPPETLPEYVAGLRSILEPLGIHASFYGHAGTGLLHVRPKVNLHSAADIAKYRQITDQVADLTRRFKGSLAGEHGVGIARTEYVAGQLGPELMAANVEVKRLFDPRNLLNPGKIIPDEHDYRIDTNLRYGAGHEIHLPFAPVLGFVDRDQSFVGNLEQCNGCGGCRKDVATMCPTYAATGEEVLSTRGRANTIRAVLEHRLGNGDGLQSPDLAAALESCLSCKACKSECPSNVDLAQLKAELNHAKHQVSGLPLLDWMIANSDLLGRMNAGPHALLINAILRSGPVRFLMEKTLGFSSDRTFPPYTTKPFTRWFARHQREQRPKATRGRVILWDDTWVRYNEPGIGQAAVKVLEAAGFEVAIEKDRQCCGRPAASRGVLDRVRQLGEHNIEVFSSQAAKDPVIFLEPSCYTMFIDDYRQMKLSGAVEVAARCITFEQFMYNLLSREPEALPLRGEPGGRIGVHAHCHAKALTDTSIMPKLAAAIPGVNARLLDTGCCGMAGAFGMLKSKYELSMAVGRDLADKIKAVGPDTTIVASGTSCRHQIKDLTGRHPLHMAELLAAAL